MSKQQRFLLAAAVLFIFVLYFWSNISRQKQVQHSGSTTFSRQALGLMIFSELGERAYPESLTISKRPILKLEDTTSDVFMLMAPKGRLSPRESRMLKDYVEKGGTLITSFYDQKSAANLLDTMFVMDLPLQFEKNLKLRPPRDKEKEEAKAKNKDKTADETTAASKKDNDEEDEVERTHNDAGAPLITIAENKKFKNGETEKVQVSTTIPFLSQGSTLEIYSPLYFQRPECRAERDASCFFYEYQIGSGRVLVMLGIPPISNALIGRSDNRQLAFNIFDQNSSILIDEYHHFFSERTFIEFLTAPRFAIPIFGMLVAAILFFLFGHSSFHYFRRPPGFQNQSQSHHALNERILRGILRKESGLAHAVAEQCEFMIRIFPERKKQIDQFMGRDDVNRRLQSGRNGTLSVANELVGLHRTFLKESGLID